MSVARLMLPNQRSPNKKGRLLAAFFIGAIIIILNGCQLAPSHSRVESNATSPSQYLSVPFFAQEKYQCGPAALASVLSYAGAPTNPETLVEEVWLPKRRGSLAMELAAAARARGLLVYPINTNTALFAELDANHPVLIQQNLLFKWLPQWHFAVVIGYDENGETLLLHSGTEQSKKVGAAWFENHWRKAEYIGFVVLKAGELPAQSEPLPLAAAIANVDHSSGVANLDLWKSAAARYPDESIIRFSYGNALYQDGSFSAAAEQYSHATKLAPAFHQAWNNLADVYKQAHCKIEAQKSIQAALKLKPENQTYQGTQLEIKALDTTEECNL